MERIHQEGGGRRAIEKKPEIIVQLEETIEKFTAGDPMNRECKWVRFSLRPLCQAMKALGYKISPTTAGRLLADNDYALRANMKSQEPGSNHPNRNTQFEHIAKTRGEFQDAELPVISIDTKKKELIGNFKNSGRAWGKEAEQVNGHDLILGHPVNPVQLWMVILSKMEMSA